MEITHRTIDELDAAIDDIAAAPRDVGTLELIVRRPALGEREVLQLGELDISVGLVGDTWNQRPTRTTDDGGPDPDKQLNLMSVRAIGAVAADRSRWPLAGDQFFVDIDLSADNLPAGTQLALGDAVIEITPSPHNGCAKFTQRFGLEAHRWVNSELGRSLRLRGACAKVIRAGTVAAGSTVTVIRRG